MPTRPRADPEPGTTAYLLRGALVALVAAGVLAMHALTGGFASGADHADMAHGDTMSASSAAAAAVALPHVSSGDDTSAAVHCGVAMVCVALIGVGLLLLLPARVRRPLLARRRAGALLTLRRIRAMARLPEPPDLHSLSILRC